MLIHHGENPGSEHSLFFALLVVIHVLVLVFFFCSNNCGNLNVCHVSNFRAFIRSNLHLDYVSFGTSSETTLDIELFTEKYNNPLTFFSSLSDV